MTGKNFAPEPLKVKSRLLRRTELPVVAPGLRGPQMESPPGVARYDWKKLCPLSPSMKTDYYNYKRCDLPAVAPGLRGHNYSYRQ